MALSTKFDLLLEPGILGVKAEFEAEGSSFQEVASLASSIPNMGLGLTVKIGGCEAVTDTTLALSLHPKQIVAPMIESSFAVKKFAAMMKSFDPGSATRRLINIETVTAFSNIDSILDTCVDEGIDGVVIGRGDLAESMMLPRISVDSHPVMTKVYQIAAQTKDRELICGVGGGVSHKSIENLVQLVDDVQIDYFETRKVLIDAQAQNFLRPLKAAFAFELSWLESRTEKLLMDSKQDEARIERLYTQVEVGGQFDN